jgi:hypothetical protein
MQKLWQDVWFIPNTIIAHLSKMGMDDDQEWRLFGDDGCIF